MTRRLLHASFLAAGALVVAASGLLAGSCRPLEGQSGVHVTVALAASGWTTTDQFDHITVTATSGDLHAVVCLSTVRGDASAFDDAGYRDGGSDPCADRADLAWTTVPTATTWRLDETARTVNFDFPEGSPVHVVAEARLGGLAAIGSAFADGTASIGGDTLDLRLAKQPTAPVACNSDTITFGESVQSDASTALLCNGATACLCAKSEGPNPMGCLGAATGLTCSTDGKRITIDPASVVDGCPSPDVGRGIAHAKTSCLIFATTVRMYRCLSSDDAGTCLTPTADCTPPDASIVTREPQTGDQTAIESLACLPPTVFGIPVSTTLHIPNSGLLSIPWIGLDVERSDDPHGCRVDLAPLTFTDCPANR